MVRTIDGTEALTADMTAWRRDLHAHPETAFEEERTSDFVAEKLASFGLEVHRGLAKTGVVGLLRNGEGPAVAFRADMDALHIHEQTNLPHASRNPGRMHACGHDGHTAMLLGAARHLSAHPNFQGTIAFVFQPAEENEGGGRVMVEDGLFEKFPADAVYGMHNIPQIPRGLFAVREGVATAFLDRFEIRLTGKGSHAAAPETGIDAIVIAANLINALQTIVSRRIGAIDSAVVTVTQIHGGDTWNVIPENVVLRGTVRTLDAAIQDRVEEAMNEICAGVGQTHGARIDMTYMRGYPGVVNTADETAAAARAAAALVGEDKVLTNIKPSMGSEDFSFMLQKRPGAYICIGAGETGSDPALHNPYYDFNDAILPMGAAFWVQLVQQQLPAG